MNIISQDCWIVQVGSRPEDSNSGKIRDQQPEPIEKESSERNDTRENSG